jgi:hypothetical protein
MSVGQFILLVESKQGFLTFKRFGIPLTGLTLPHFCACPKPGTGFPTSYAMVFVCDKINKDSSIVRSMNAHS